LCKTVNWTILSGEAFLNIDGKSYELKAHQTFLPDAGKSVKLKNTGRTPLVFIEVATGIDAKTDHFDETC
jgi:mannose-6-phosphate isomerase-like protein (cupin superfamily)